MASRGGLNQPLMAGSDPFNTFREELRRKCGELTIRHDEWKPLLQVTNTVEDLGFVETTEALKKDIQAALTLCKKVQITVSAVQKNRSKFPHIDDAELESRVSFMNTTKSGKFERDRRQALTRGAGGGAGEDSSNKYFASNAEYLAHQQQQMQRHREDQDEILDDIGDGVLRLEEMAIGINQELDEQKVMLNTVDEEIDEAQSKMDKALGLIGKILKTKDRCQLGMILFLGLVVVGLGIGVFTTL